MKNGRQPNLPRKIKTNTRRSNLPGVLHFICSCSWIQAGSGRELCYIPFLAHKATPVNGLSRHKNQCAHWYLFHGSIDRGIFTHSFCDKQSARGALLHTTTYFGRNENYGTTLHHHKSRPHRPLSKGTRDRQLQHYPSGQMDIIRTSRNSIQQRGSRSNNRVHHKCDKPGAGRTALDNSGKVDSRTILKGEGQMGLNEVIMATFPAFLIVAGTITAIWYIYGEE